MEDPNLQDQLEEERCRTPKHKRVGPCARWGQVDDDCGQQPRQRSAMLYALKSPLEISWSAAAQGEDLPKHADPRKPKESRVKEIIFLFRLVKLDLVQGPTVHQPAVVSSLLSFLLKVEHPFFNSIFADVVVIIISINDHNHQETINVIFVFPQWQLQW